jgi:hypothetical protein
MKAEEFVRQKYPNATIEKQIRFAPLRKITYWIVRAEPNAFDYIATGNTQSNAWVNAKNEINESMNA